MSKQLIKNTLDTLPDDFVLAMFSHIDMPLCIRDEHLDMLYLNDALCALFELSRDDMRSRSLRDIVGPETAAVVERTLREVVTSEESRVLERRVVLSNKELLLSMQFSLLKTSSDKKFIVETFHDITHQRQTEERLKSSRAFEASILRNLSAGVHVLHDLDAPYVQVNDLFAEMLGYSKSELLTKTDLDITHPDDVAYTRDCRKLIEAGAYTLPLKKRYLRKDGSTMWADISASVIRDEKGEISLLTGVIVDITARIKAEERQQALLEENKHTRIMLQRIMDSIPEGVLAVDEEMHIQQGNQAFNRLFSCDTAQLEGNKANSISSFAASPAFNVLKECLDTQKATREYRLKFTTANGENVILAISGTPLREAETADSGAVLVVRDITRLVDLEERLHERTGFGGLVGKSPAMTALYDLLKQLTTVDSTVLILGESGTGKELVAEALHYGSSRKNGPLIKVNCSALSESILESELFGHVRGAFSGAISDKVGRFEAAQGGTIFLDEIGDASPSIQLKLLRILETKEFERVGESKTRKADVRIVAATNVDLADKVKKGEVRQDLFYRLSIMTVNMPPLRERNGDLRLLADHFLHIFARDFNKDIWSISHEAYALLMGYSWPGNVRELKHAIEHACLLCNGAALLPEHLPQSIRDHAAAQTPPAHKSPEPVSGKPTRDQVLAALEASSWKKARAARLLGIHRSTLYRIMDKLGITHD